MTSLARKFNFFTLVKFATPSMLMMLVTSLYSIVDSIFVSRYVGTNALSAINIVYPVINVILAVAIMLASGGSAVIAKELGEGKQLLARQHLTLIFAVGMMLSVAIMVVGIVFINPILLTLGANKVLYDYCYDYLLIMLLFTPVNMLQLLLQNFFVTAGRPALGMASSLVGGIINVVLDFTFIAVLDMGIAGAALGTGIGYIFPCLVGIIFFIKGEHSLRLTKPIADFKMLLKSCSNGSSEMVTNLAIGLSTFLYNIVMLRLAGEDGVAAMTIVLYAQFLLGALGIGFSMGVAPVISYNYGAKNEKRLKSVFKICFIFIAILSVTAFVAAMLLASPIALIFTPKTTAVYGLSVTGMHLFAYSFLFAGFNIMASALFTALSNGKISAIISFMRTLVCTVISIVVFSALFGINGVWLATLAAEVMSICVSIYFVLKYRKKYNYL